MQTADPISCGSLHSRLVRFRQPSAYPLRVRAKSAEAPQDRERTSLPQSPGGALDSTNGGGSLDHAFKDSKPPELPEGLHLPTDRAVDQSSTQIALARSGIYTNTGMVVIKLKPEAASAGIKMGDVVESFSGNVVTVRRGGQTMQISIH